MSLFVDTSVWSLAFRRDVRSTAPEVDALIQALQSGQLITTTGLVLQELLQAFVGPKQRGEIVSKFSALPLLSPDRSDHIEAAELRNTCRRSGIQIGTIDALLSQLCIRHGLSMLTADSDFQDIAKHSLLKLWRAPGSLV